jgi:hypothetical protein
MRPGPTDRKGVRGGLGLNEQKDPDPVVGELLAYARNQTFVHRHRRWPG